MGLCGIITKNVSSRPPQEFLFKTEGDSEVSLYDTLIGIPDSWISKRDTVGYLVRTVFFATIQTL